MGKPSKDWGLMETSSLNVKKHHNWGFVCWDNQQEYEDLTSNAEHGGFFWRCNEVRVYSMDFNRS